MTDFLQLSGKTILVMGVANRKSVAWHVGQVLSAVGADVVYCVRSEARRDSVQKLVGNAPVFVCDLEHEDQIARLRNELAEIRPKLHGLCHSIAFADYGAVADSRQWNQALSPNAEGRVLAGHRYFLLFANRRIQRIAGTARSGCLGRHRVDFHHANGGGKLWLHGAGESGARFVFGVSRQIVQQLFARTVQRRGAGPC